MALKLLQPGLQPLGQFDLLDDTVLLGGEWVEVEAAAGTESAAADVTQVGPLTGLSFDSLTFAPAAKGTVSGAFGGLADEGTTGYGTLYGTVIGGTAGQGTGFGTLSSAGVVVVGPQTTTGSGKVTVWHAPGLYGVSGAPATGGAVEPLSGLAVNTSVESNTVGYLGGSGMTGAGGTQLGIALGAVRDTSLVSTTATAAGLSAQTEFYALYLKAL
jgi:hypothetical protein